MPHITTTSATSAVNLALLPNLGTLIISATNGKTMSKNKHAGRYGKPCTDCSIILSEENAVKSTGNLLCKPCFNARNRAWRAGNQDALKAIRSREYAKNKHRYIASATAWAKENREKRKTSSKTWRWKLRIEMIAAYGGKCACCSETIPEFLTIDHINNDGYQRRVEGEQSGAALYRWLKNQGYPKDNYQLLCMNCNFAKGHFGECPHHKQRDAEDLTLKEE